MNTEEIEFRAWDYDTKKMYDVKSLLLSIDPPRVVVDRKGVGTSSDSEDLVLFSYDLLQYTGVKCKNGDKIFQDDILRSRGRVMVVIKQDGCFLMIYKGDEFFLDEIRHDCEIIGNAYEVRPS